MENLELTKYELVFSNEIEKEIYEDYLNNRGIFFREVAGESENSPE